MERFYISDTHFKHTNTIKYCNRPFETAAEMDKFMAQAWADTVKPEDHITHLGDVTIERGGRVKQLEFIKLIQSLPGHKRLHLGNHDHFPIKTYASVFEKIYATWRDEGGLLFSHIPIHGGSIGSARANIHGHIHQNPSPPPIVWTSPEGKRFIKPYINISVETTDYKPIHYDEILARVRLAIEAQERLLG